jgi:hypothetical protein
VLHQAFAPPTSIIIKKGLRIEAIRVFWLGVYNLPVNVHWILILEGWEPGQHLVDKDAQAPPVYWFSVTLIQKDFWSNILWGAANSEGAFGNDFSEAEVNHLQISILPYHYIFWFQVTIDDIFRMQVLKDSEYLGTVENCLFKVKMLY